MFNFESVDKNTQENNYGLDESLKGFIEENVNHGVGTKIKAWSMAALTAIASFSNMPTQAQVFARLNQGKEKEIAKNTFEALPRNQFGFSESITGVEDLDKVFYVGINKVDMLLPDTDEVIVLEAGDKVVQTGVVKDHVIEVLVWKDGEYFSGVVDARALTSEVRPEFQSRAFAVDALHVIDRAKKRIFNDTQGCYLEMFQKYGNKGQGSITKEQMQKQIDYSVHKNQEFINFIDQAGLDFSEISDDKYISSEYLEAAQNKHMQVYENPLYSKGEKIQYAVDNILETYNPVVDVETGERFGDNITVMPLSMEYLQSNAWLQTQLEKNETLISLFRGASGEVVIAEDERFAEIISLLKGLQDHKNELPVGFEKKWIESLDIDKLAKQKALIAISDATYDMQPKDKFAEGVAIGHTFGNFKIHPLQSVLVHEMNMAGDFFPKDTHMAPEQVLETLGAVNEKGQDCVLASPESVDNLYQSESYVEIFNLAYLNRLLREVKE